MTNPGWQLHDLYTGWREALDAQPQPLADIVHPLTEKGAAQIIRGVALVGRIDSLLTELEKAGFRVGVYKRQLPDWLGGLIGFTGGWLGDIASETLITQQHMDEIEAVASFLDGKVLVADVSQPQTLRTLMSDARKLLEEDTSLNAQLRQYIHRLLSLIEAALDDEAIGTTFDYGSSLEALGVAFMAAAGQSAQKKKWHDLFAQFSTATASGLVLEAVKVTTTAIMGGAQ